MDDGTIIAINYIKYWGFFENIFRVLPIINPEKTIKYASYKAYYNEYKENKNSEIKREDRGIENRGEDRQFRNRNLRDLIKILLIRELLGGIRNPGRPPMPPPRPPMRPPFPGGPGRPPFGPGPRPNNRYYDIYEY